MPGIVTDISLVLNIVASKLCRVEARNLSVNCIHLWTTLYYKSLHSLAHYEFLVYAAV